MASTGKSQRTSRRRPRLLTSVSISCVCAASRIAHRRASTTERRRIQGDNDAAPIVLSCRARRRLRLASAFRWGLQAAPLCRAIAHINLCSAGGMTGVDDPRSRIGNRTPQQSRREVARAPSSRQTPVRRLGVGFLWRLASPAAIRDAPLRLCSVREEARRLPQGIKADIAPIITRNVSVRSKVQYRGIADADDGGAWRVERTGIIAFPTPFTKPT